MNKTRKVLLMCSMLLCSVMAQAYDFEVNGMLFNVISEENSTCELTLDESTFWQTPYSGDVIVPSTVEHNGKTYTVTGIGEDAFSNGYEITSVVMPQTITYIGEFAFYYCTLLQEVVIPDSVRHIGDYAFGECSELQQIVIPAAVDSLGENIISKCPKLTSIVVEEGNKVYDSRGNCNAIIETKSNILVSGCGATIIPSTVTRIGVAAFNGASLVGVFEIPGQITEIGERAFIGCVEMTGVVIPESVRCIKDATFSTTGLTEVTIPTSVDTLCAWAFRNCANLKRATILAAPAIMEPCLFEDCSYLESVRLPEGLESIPSYMFRNCKSLQNVNIPSTVTHINQKVFYSCYGLKSVTLPQSLKTIDGEVFYNCMNLESVTMLSQTPPVSEEKNQFDYCDALKTIYVPLGAAQAYDVEPWNQYQIVEQDMTSIDAVAISGNAPCDVYDLDGRVVKRNATNLDGLKHGIYIVNGKKVRK